MKLFAELLDRLLYTPSRNAKIALLVAYLKNAPDPDRGWALAAFTGDLDLQTVKAAGIRRLVESRVDPALFAWSYDYVGDLAETTALIWSGAANTDKWPRLSGVVDRLQQTARGQSLHLVEEWLDQLDATGRWALLKLLTGGLRVGVSAGLAKNAVATYGNVESAHIEEVWHSLTPPYRELFDWLDGSAERPDPGERAVFRSPMLAHPIGENELDGIDPQTFAAEWKWDGIRVQISARKDEVKLYSRSGDDISHSFPDVVEALGFEGVLDGELLVVKDGAVQSFQELQLRLNRKRVTKKLLQDQPAFIRLYDLLFDGTEDIRELPFAERRRRLEHFVARQQNPNMDISPLVPFSDLNHLKTLRDASRENGTEGLMLKQLGSPYIAGRPKGLWFKWKRDPLHVDTVLMYAQRGHGKRSSFYSDYTFGAWREDGELVPVGKAYFGFTDEELKQIDKWVRDHTIKKYGPVREVERGLVFEVAFDSVHPSPRHKSGIAMRFPRIARIRWDKPAEEADRVETLSAFIKS